MLLCDLAEFKPGVFCHNTPSPYAILEPKLLVYFMQTSRCKVICRGVLLEGYIIYLS